MSGSSQETNERVEYYVPGEVVFVEKPSSSYPSNRSINDIRQQLKKNIPSSLRQDISAHIDRSRVLQRSSRSVVCVDLGGRTVAERAVIAANLTTDFQQITGMADFYKPTFNWFASGAQGGQLTTGGPGGRPRRPRTYPSDASLGKGANFVTGESALEETGQTLVSGPSNIIGVSFKNAQRSDAANRGKVAVVILDTAPPVCKFETQHSHELRWEGLPFRRVQATGLKWDGFKGSQPDMVDQMKKENMWVYYNQSDAMVYLNCELKEKWTEEKKKRKHAAIKDHNYYMSDHGLFIANIVHSIAPDAELHLVQVLNDQGVGTVETTRQGFDLVEKLREKHPETQIIVNLSFTLGMPPNLDTHYSEWIQLIKDVVQRCEGREDCEEYPIERLAQFADGMGDSANAVQLKKFVCDMVEPVEEICKAVIEDPNIILAAAAGNEGENGNRPVARFPAAFEDVIGVGALNQDLEPASYSCVADHPDSDGFLAFGGDCASTLAGCATIFRRFPDIVKQYLGRFWRDWSATDEGMLGPYVADEYPDGTINDIGWARWAGTSFATPIVAGALAQLIFSGESDPEKKLREWVIEREREHKIPLIQESIS